MEIAKGGFRKDLGIFVRSKMEANVARFYNYLGLRWEYEPQEFEFHEIKRGQRYYKPDFKLYDINACWVEVKGNYLRTQDKTKLRRFKKYYPEEFKKLRFVIPDKYARSKDNGIMIGFLCGELKVDFKLISSYKDMQKWGNLLVCEWE